MENDETPRTTIIKGVIENLQTRIESREAVFSADDKQALQGTALAAATVGLGAIAVGLSASDDFTSDDGEMMTFDLQGKHVEAWVWHSEFKDGDEVEVAAEQINGRWIGFAVRRLSDGMIAVYPHCERGSAAFYVYAGKFVGALYGSGFAVLYVVGALINYFQDHYDWKLINVGMAWVFFITTLMAGFITWRVARRFSKARRLADRIFSAYGWKKPSFINLPRESNRDRRAGDTLYMGISIFRYNPK
ncbi:putative type VI secretion system effector [Robbsia andropogonis]|uniref:putative type VI secretion system effector n=1 Tax=Robbsia andropogonis TaxID=28092 RepID=UPI00209E1A29|nr:putative type VI secretion system effector [Robbsia andropogonis]MCP1117227.1 hypothetical protein [Robbsia andropogonis]MCP1128573.1 hypothetical protein [Robbsia andropogonis]